MDHTPHLLLFAEDFYPPGQIFGGVRVCVFHQVLQLSRRWRVTVVAPIHLLPPLARYAAAHEAARKSAAARAADFDCRGCASCGHDMSTFRCCSHSPGRSSCS
jgi:hypothetical protein